jgi:hypothetical protein
MILKGVASRTDARRIGIGSKFQKLIVQTLVEVGVAIADE